MMSIKITITLLFCALFVWLISNLPNELSQRIYDIGSFIFGILGVLFLISFLILFIYSRFYF